MDEAAQQILTWLEQRRDAMADLLEELARLETPSRDPSAQEPILALLGEQLRQAGCRVIRVHGRRTGGYLYAAPARRPQEVGWQLLTGHCDTVWPVGTLQTMPVTREAGEMRGPGVYDMKAGLVQIVFALQAMADLNLRPALTPLVLINSDEEIGSIESTPAISRLARRCRRAFVMEPPLGLEGKIKTARKGVGRFTLTVRGVSAHAGLNPRAGASAILELSHQIQNLFAMNDPGRGITVNVGMVEGGIAANVVAPESRAVADVRVLNLTDGEEISRRIKALRPVNPETTLAVEGSFGRPPLEKTPRNQELWALARREGRKLGLELEEGTAGGGSDGNTTSLYCATLDGLGTVGDGAHARHEFIYLDKLVERAALLTLLTLAPP